MEFHKGKCTQLVVTFPRAYDLDWLGDHSPNLGVCNQPFFSVPDTELKLIKIKFQQCLAHFMWSNHIILFIREIIELFFKIKNK